MHFFRQFLECLPDNSTLLTILDKETREVIGGMLLLTSPSNETLYYPYGGTLTGLECASAARMGLGGARHRFSFVYAAGRALRRRMKKSAPNRFTTQLLLNF
ncbi:hypothetical protein PAESOLCIP111_06598 [Paenibacillus solanacearum]|uniref:BioF2-like acetyltransferase domain-containing protein n=1 Tax=Paenibacillus solanacearum TaxID=2048548 RepID=A0A916K8J7_9BACL|nr:hypothetical protein [Paenibacillus solanacearum]CAG7652674.1 hypothetical protein PAESOLCIP111_06598 [Paenibacillus solanacearum]